MSNFLFTKEFVKNILYNINDKISYVQVQNNENSGLILDKSLYFLSTKVINNTELQISISIPKVFIGDGYIKSVKVFGGDPEILIGEQKDLRIMSTSSDDTVYMININMMQFTKNKNGVGAWDASEVR